MRPIISHLVGLTSGKGNDALDTILGAGGLDYAYIDFAATDRLYQVYAGLTPADDPSEVIGLGIGKYKQGRKTLRQVMLSQPELIPDPELNDAAAWSDSDQGTGVSTISGGQIVLNGPDFNNRAERGLATPFATVAGRLYQIEADCISTLTQNFILPFTSTGTAIGTAADYRPNAASGTVLFYFVATTASSRIVLRGQAGANFTVSRLSVKEVPAKYATQATASYKPTYQTAGAKFDATDDYLSSTWYSQNGENSIIAQIAVPASISAAQVIAGSSGAAGADALFFGINTLGKLAASVGSQAFSSIVGATDFRGTSAVVALSVSATTVSLFAGSAVEYSGAPAGSINSTIAHFVGARNANCGALNFFGGNVKKIAFGRKAISLPEFVQIKNQWLAA
jgi:hypothetical protein